MKFETIASNLTRSRTRMAGTYTSALLITTDSGKQGRGLFTYEYDKRDVVDESLSVEPHIADEVKAEIDEDDMGVSGYNDIFGDNETTGDQNEITKTEGMATISVYEMD